MYLQQAQTIVFLLILLALACAPAVWRWARRRDAEPQPASPAPADPTRVPGVLTPREAVAHHLYGQAVGWERQAMADYDNSLELQNTWWREADRKLRRG